MQPPPMALKLVEFGTYILPVIILIIMALYLSTTNRSGDLFNPYVWGLCILVPFFIALLIAKHTSAALSKVGTVGVIIGILAGVYFMKFLYQQAANRSFFLGKASDIVAQALMVIFGMGILFSTLYSYTRYRTWTGFWMKLFFYIPCLIVDAIVDISQDIGVTPRPVLVLFVLELMLIIWYVWGDKIASWVRSRIGMGEGSESRGKHILQSTPILLHAQQEVILANNEQLSITKPQAIQEKNPYRKSYTISCWVFVNTTMSVGSDRPDAQVQSHEGRNDYGTGRISPPEFNLLFYGSKALDKDNQWMYVDPKPRLTYQYDKETKSDTYLVYVDPSTPYKLFIANQKWNQFVFVYQDTIGNGHIDLFVNGHLVKSWGNIAMPRFSANDKIMIGDESNKLYGSIQGVTYYERALSPQEVSTTYNTEYLSTNFIL